MPFTLGDIFIGDFKETQAFGARPDFYSARFGIKGHNGLDFGCPSLTMILSAADGTVIESGFDTGGYGNYVKILHSGYLTLYGHLNDLLVKKGDHVIAGQLIAHSDNTGNSDGPHLHFGVAPADTNGNKTEPGNGYSGYIDPNSSLCHWDVKNLKAPVSLQANEQEQQMLIPSSTFTRLVTKATNDDVVLSFLLQNGLNEYLTGHSLPTIDANSSTPDPKTGEHIVLFLADKLIALKELEETKNVQTGVSAMALNTAITQATPGQRDGFLLSLGNAISHFIFAGQ